MVADDTNVWVNNTSEKVTVNEDGQEEKQERNGMKRTSPLLGMLQFVCLKRTDGTSDCIALHSPSQLLPRQNAGTILSRIRRWAVYCSSGCSTFFGGRNLYSLFEKVPLKVIIFCPALSRLPAESLNQIVKVKVNIYCVCIGC